MDQNLLEKALLRLDELLCEKREGEVSFTVCGGGALVLQKLISRDTSDLDVVAPAINEQVRQLVKQVAIELRLSEYWLNSHADSLTKDLPKGWDTDLVLVFNGMRLKIFSLSRMNIIRSKFWASCDREEDDMDDLVKLKPSMQELQDSVNWTLPLDGNPEWHEQVQRIARKLKSKLGYD